MIYLLLKIPMILIACFLNYFNSLIDTLKRFGKAKFNKIIKFFYTLYYQKYYKQ
jgi:hypothetical protein